MNGYDPRKRDPKRSTPRMLAVRMDEAKAEGRPMAMEYDEVTGVINVALARARANTDAAIDKVNDVIARLNATKRHDPEPA